MFNPAILGRELTLPPSPRDWALLIAALAITALALHRVADRPTAMLGVAIGVITYTIDKHLALPMTLMGVALLAAAVHPDAHASRPGPRALKQGVIIGAGFLVYEQGREIFIGDAEVALRNGERVLALERWLHLAFEPALQRPVLDHETVLRAINAVYSWAYLPFVLGALFWLYLSDERSFTRMRNALGVSVLLALATIALYPTAPPRLVPSSDLIDTHALLGRAHGFVNPFAAVPSFHVGWTALSGYALFRSVRGRIRWLWGIGPVTVMSVTVMLTGNHFWLDGVVGAVYALGPFLIFERAASHRPARADRWLAGVTSSLRAVRASAWSHWSIASLTLLLAYLLGRQMIDPWFTHYWGYMVAQIAVTIALLIGMEGHFKAEGGLSWLTYAVVVVATWADTLGTAGHMYDRYAGYDKVIHFGGGVAITAVAADLLFAHRRKRRLPARLGATLALALAFSLTLNIGWEIYEYLGDRLFDTGRHAGRLDTIYDLICDTTGALLALALLRQIERRRFERAAPGANEPRPRSRWPLHPPAATVERLAQTALSFGLIAPIMLFGAMWLAAAPIADYSHLSGTVSDLAEQGRPRAEVMQLGILLCGVLLALHACALVRIVPWHRVALTASMLGTSLAVMLAALFQDYRTGGPRNREGYLHNTFGVLVIGGALISMALMASVAIRAAAWRPLFWPSLIAIEVVACDAALFVWGPERFEGLVQRMLFTAAFAWLVSVTAVALHLQQIGPAREGAVRGWRTAQGGGGRGAEIDSVTATRLKQTSPLDSQAAVRFEVALACRPSSPEVATNRSSDVAMAHQ